MVWGTQLMFSSSPSVPHLHRRVGRRHTQLTMAVVDERLRKSILQYVKSCETSSPESRDDALTALVCVRLRCCVLVLTVSPTPTSHTRSSLFGVSNDMLNAPEPSLRDVFAAGLAHVPSENGKGAGAGADAGAVSESLAGTQGRSFVVQCVRTRAMCVTRRGACRR